MAKRTAVIDIGSNSTRMTIYEKSGRFSFHIIKETKSKVRIGEGAYNNNGNLQDFAIQRANSALKEFSIIAKNLSCNKILCIATSALRDAPNSDVFLKNIKKQFGFDIKIIDGNKEAYYGAIAVINMLNLPKEVTTIDIGGGSTELAKIKNGKIIKTVSINLGTVRLKELFYDKKILKNEIVKFIKKELLHVGSEFTSSHVVGIGGTIRALGKLYMEQINYPIATVHNFKCESEKILPLISKISNSSLLNLKSIGIKKDRLDTIREGLVIFETIIDKFCAKNIIISGVGIREGVYLSDLLRTMHDKFPTNFLLSFESLKHRFIKNNKESNMIAKSASALFDVLAPIHQIEDSYKHELVIASKLHSIGRVLNFYQEHLHTSYFILNNLNYGFLHKQKILISTIVKFYSKKITESSVQEYKELLPDIKTVNWLIFLFSLSKILYTNCSFKQIHFSYNNHTLHVHSDFELNIAKDLIKRVPKPASFAISIT